MEFPRRTRRPNQARFQVIALRDGPYDSKLREAGYAVEQVDAPRLRNPANCYRAFQQVAEHAKSFQSDVIFSWMAYGHLFGGAVAHQLELPCIWSPNRVRRRWLDRLASLIPADRVLGVSQRIADRQRHLSLGRVVVPVYPRNRLGAFAQARKLGEVGCRRVLRLPENRPTVVIVGRLQRWKGMHRVIDAMPGILDRFDDACLYIVGGEHPGELEYAQNLRDQVDRLQLSDRVILTGMRDQLRSGWERLTL